LPLGLALPLCFFMFREPGAAGKTVAAGSAPAIPLSGLTRNEALRDRRFWLIALVLLPISFALAGAVPNLEGILTDHGFTPATILRLTPLIGLASITGRLIGGWLLDRFWAPAVAFAILGMPAISCVLLAMGDLSPVTGAIAIFLIGFALGTEYDVVAYLTARYFGMRAYSAIYSVFYVCFSTGAGFAPLVFGLIRDGTHDYAPVLHFCAVILPLSSAGFLLLGKYPVAWMHHARKDVIQPI